VRAGIPGGLRPFARLTEPDLLLLIFVFAGLHMAGLSQLAIYPVLAVYFFPWGTAFGKRGIEFA
jgi:hypothetical protein